MNQITLEQIDAYIAENQQDESAFLKSATEYSNDVIDYFYNPQIRHGHPLPWLKCHNLFDLRPAEVTLWLGYNGHGKSLVLGQITNKLLSDDIKVCIASFEMRPAATLARMCRQASGGEMPSIQYIKDFHNWSDQKLYIYDQHGSTPPQRVINLCRYAASIGIEHIIIDSLMKVVEAEDDYNGQKKFVNDLCVLARDTGLHIHLVHHSRKGQDENKIPGKMDAKGTGAITDLVDNCCSVFRVKNKKDPTAPDAYLTVDKQRHGEWEGAFGLWFAPEAQSFKESANAPVRGITMAEVAEAF